MQNNFDTQTDDPLPIPTPSTSSESAMPQTSSNSIPFQGNNYDLVALIGLVIGGVTLFSCGTLGFGYYCLPVLPIILGIVGLLTAKDSLNPDRTRLFSWLSIGAGGVFLLLIIVVIGLYISLIAFGVMADGSF